MTLEDIVKAMGPYTKAELAMPLIASALDALAARVAALEQAIKPTPEEAVAAALGIEPAPAAPEPAGHDDRCAAQGSGAIDCICAPPDSGPSHQPAPGAKPAPAPAPAQAPCGPDDLGTCDGGEYHLTLTPQGLHRRSGYCRNWRCAGGAHHHPETSK